MEATRLNFYMRPPSGNERLSPATDKPEKSCDNSGYFFFKYFDTVVEVNSNVVRMTERRKIWVFAG